MPEDGRDRPDVLPVGQVKRRERMPERVRPGVLEARAPDEAVPLVHEGAVRLGPDQLGDHGKAVERPDPHLAKPLALQLDGHPCPEPPPWNGPPDRNPRSGPASTGATLRQIVDWVQHHAKYHAVETRYLKRVGRILAEGKRETRRCLQQTPTNRTHS